MRIFTSDGATFEAPSAALVVRALANASWMAHPSKRTWKESVQERVLASTGEKIQIKNPGSMLHQLERLGFLTVVEPPSEKFEAEMRAAEERDEAGGG